MVIRRGVWVGVAVMLLGSPVPAAEHAGQEHGGEAVTHEETGHEHGGAPVGQEHGGQVVSVVPSAEQIRQTIVAYVTAEQAAHGGVTIADDVTGASRQLEFVRVHDRVGKTGNLYYSCTDMRDLASGEVLDLDFDVMEQDGTLSVVDVRIHKVEGQARYTYDANDNRVPVL